VSTATRHVTLSLERALESLLREHKAPALSTLLDEGARAWLRARGVEPGPRQVEPGHVVATRARREKSAK